MIERSGAEKILEREMDAYRARTPKSAALYERARHALPLGVASSFQAYEPYPLFMANARGAHIRDADGNDYLDFDMAFGVLAAGHSHPILAEELAHRVANGTCFTFPVEDGVLLAEEIKRRFNVDLVRFSNSGTEATMDAIRVARGFTGRTKILKFEGGYHGHHDAVLVSIQPPIDAAGPASAPVTVPASAGLSASATTETVIAPFNQPEVLEEILERHSGEVAAIIIEPVQFNIGVVPPADGYLERVRSLASQHGAVLIFDEVKTGAVLAYGGATEFFGVQPDLVCLAKSIGGGIAIGAFGGRDDVMSAIERLGPASIGAGVEHSSIPAGLGRVAHLGTFNGNPLAMAAGLTVLTRILTPDVYPRLRERGDRLTSGCQAIIDRYGLPGYAVNVGPKGCVMFTPQRVTNYRDFNGLDTTLWAASFFYLANRGLLLPPGADDQWTLSVAHDDSTIDAYLTAFDDFGQDLSRAS